MKNGRLEIRKVPSMATSATWGENVTYFQSRCGNIDMGVATVVLSAGG